MKLKDIDGLDYKLLRFLYGRGVAQRVGCARNKFYGQAERAISTGQLNVLLRLHIQPIDVVVFHGPS